MTILSSHFPYNLTAGIFHKRIVYDIDTISEAEGNGAESVTEPDTGAHDEQLDIRPENQLGLLENQYWGVRLSHFDGSTESNKQGEFLFSCKDGLG